MTKDAQINKEELSSVLVTDCGSTTTKALLFEKTPEGWRQTFRGEAPTTVEEPTADVTIGALNAFTEIQELSGRKVIKDSSSDGIPFEPANKGDGIDLYLSTSSAGGGLQMMCAGIVKTMSAESAERAALGAGAIVLDTISADDGREDYERIERIRHLRPDIVLLAGGVNGGSVTHPVEMAETLFAAAPRPRFGDTLQLPVIYAGNNAVASSVEEILESIASVSVVPNVRPTIETEALGPAREAIHEFFLSHVMSHSPGYGKLLSWTPVPVMPTPAAVGDMVQAHAERKKETVLAADIGGATTDVFSVFNDEDGTAVFNRTVSANLGMSYSVANVLIEAGPRNIARWLPYEISDNELRDRLRNKMIRPTSIPQAPEDLWLEQAVCREALRLSLDHHRMLAVGLSGVQKQRGIADIFSQASNRYELVDLKKLDLAIGSGGVLSHAPDRLSAALMILDGFALEGITQIAVDSIFMMPHLGVLASVHPEAAAEIFINDCLISIAYGVVPIFSKKIPEESPVADVFVDDKKVGEVISGSVTLVDVDPGSLIKLRVEPMSKKVDVGAGRGNSLEKEVISGSHGLILDGRNRPIEFSDDEKRQARYQKEMLERLGLMQ